MLKKILVIMVCSVAAIAVGSFSKLQQSLSRSSAEPVGQKLANGENLNCACSCTYKPEGPSQNV